MKSEDTEEIKNIKDIINWCRHVIKLAAPVAAMGLQLRPQAAKQIARKIRVIFRVRFERRKVDKKAN